MYSKKKVVKIVILESYENKKIENNNGPKVIANKQAKSADFSLSVILRPQGSIIFKVCIQYLSLFFDLLHLFY